MQIDFRLWSCQSINSAPCLLHLYPWQVNPAKRLGCSTCHAAPASDNAIWLIPLYLLCGPVWSIPWWKKRVAGLCQDLSPTLVPTTSFFSKTVLNYGFNEMVGKATTLCLDSCQGQCLPHETVRALSRPPAARHPTGRVKTGKPA